MIDEKVRPNITSVTYTDQTSCGGDDGTITIIADTNDCKGDVIYNV
jgi:hypothetical protein